jgi:lipoate synthase
MSDYVRKPQWLKVRLGDNDCFLHTRKIIEGQHLNTICSSGRCPNQAECWSRGTATFMVLGTICTRSCRFCNTETGKPLPPDLNEPERLAQSVRQMGLRHVVLTSVDRDDLPDLGAAHWVRVIRSVRRVNPETTIEVLIPDFQGCPELIRLIIDERPEIVSHNVETVRRLTPEVRSAAFYERSLSVLRQLSDAGIRTKSGLMLGLGETEEELFETMDDILHTGCSILTLGQYLQPTRKHFPVKKYIHPDDFSRYKELATLKGFAFVESGPLVRSSYHAEKHLYSGKSEQI